MHRSSASTWLALMTYAYRVSYFCKLRFIASTGAEHLHIAMVLNFIRATNADGLIKRLATCKLMRASQSIGHLLKCTAGQQAAAGVDLVEVDMLDEKLVTARRGGSLYGMPYGNTSGMR